MSVAPAALGSVATDIRYNAEKLDSKATARDGPIGWRQAIDEIERERP
jgi:hypothetical protein